MALLTACTGTPSLGDGGTTSATNGGTSNTSGGSVGSGGAGGNAGADTKSVAKAIAAGTSYACALLSGGMVRCWGYNLHGQLGTVSAGTCANGDGGVRSCSLLPIAVPNVTDATALTAGQEHACVLSGSGTVQCWGWNASGQLGDGTTIDSPVPVTVFGITNATAVAAGGDHTCALLGDGTVQCWGGNVFGQLGNDTSASCSNVEGDAPPQPCSPKPVSVATITSATAVAAGLNHTCVLLSGGSVQCWGANLTGELGDGTTSSSGRTKPQAVLSITDATGITAGYWHTCALLNGTLRCWGDNAFGELGDGTTTNGTVPVTVLAITDATGVAEGAYHTCALSNNSVQCWGWNGYGELGNGTTTNSTVPVAVPSLTNATAVAVGSCYSCVLLANGAAQCWGRNVFGQLGNGTNENSTTPTAVIFP